jgi:hypothetical protein
MLLEKNRATNFIFQDIKKYVRKIREEKKFFKLSLDCLF